MLAKVYVLQSRHDDALKQCLAAVARLPSSEHNIDAETFHDLGWLYEQMGKHQLSKENYLRAAELYETICANDSRLQEAQGRVWERHAMHARYLGIIYEKLDKGDEALRCLDGGYTRRP